MIARRESCMVLSDRERTLDILFEILALRISEICTSSMSGWVSGDCVLILALSQLRIGITIAVSTCQIKQNPDV